MFTDGQFQLRIDAKSRTFGLCLPIEGGDGLVVCHSQVYDAPPSIEIRIHSESQSMTTRQGALTRAVVGGVIGGGLGVVAGVLTARQVTDHFEAVRRIDVVCELLVALRPEMVCPVWDCGWAGPARSDSIEVQMALATAEDMRRRMLTAFLSG